MPRDCGLSALQLPFIKGNLPAIAAAIDNAVPGSFQVVECGAFTRKKPTGERTQYLVFPQTPENGWGHIDVAENTPECADAQYLFAVNEYCRPKHAFL